MGLDDKTKPMQGKDQPNQDNQGGPDRNNRNRPTGGTSAHGQNPGRTDKSNDQELDEQGRATGQMSNQKESNRMAGTSAGGKASEDRGSSAQGSKE